MSRNCSRIWFLYIGIVYCLVVFVALHGKSWQLHKPTVLTDSELKSVDRKRDSPIVDPKLKSVKPTGFNLQLQSGMVDANQCFQLDPMEYRCLPSFIIAGAMKSGTGELMKWLNLHPALVSGKSQSGENELHFFTRGYDSLLESFNYGDNQNILLRQYLSMFPRFSSAEILARQTFDKSPDYIRCPAALRRIHTMLPEIKLIVILRNPTLRLLSSFEHNCRHRRYGRLLKSIATIQVENTSGCIETKFKLLQIPLQVNRNFKSNTTVWVEQGAVINTNSVWESSQLVHQNAMKICKFPCSEQDFIAYLFTHNRNILDAAIQEISIGFFDEQIDVLLRIFPKENVLVLFQENMIRNTFPTLRQVEAFLGIEHVDYSQWAAIQSLNGTEGPPQRRQQSNLLNEMLALTGLRNAAPTIRSSEKLHQKLRSSPDTAWVLDALNSLYHPHNRRLEAILKDAFNISLPDSWKPVPTV